MTAVEQRLAIDDLADRVLTPTVGPVHANGHGAEVIAAHASSASSSPIRLLVLCALADAGPDGCTDAELERILERPRPTPGNRRGDLVSLGCARKAHRKRPHPVTQNPCEVWVITTYGLAVLAHLGGVQNARRIAAQL